MKVNAVVAWLFGIHQPTAFKWVWMGMVALNVMLMLVLAVRGAWAVKPFMLASAAAAMLQKSPVWGMWGEWGLLVTGGLFVAGLTKPFPGSRYRLMLACGFLGLLIWLVPDPQENYPRMQFYMRLHGSMAYCAFLLGALTWEWRKPSMAMVIAAIWFVPALIASASVGWDIAWWTVQMVNTGVATMCLAGWIMAGGLESPASAGRGLPSNP